MNSRPLFLSLALLSACGSTRDVPPTNSTDVIVDQPSTTDLAVDRTPDVATDLAVDRPADVATDLAVDRPADAATDSSIDAATDATDVAIAPADVIGLDALTDAPAVLADGGAWTPIPGGACNARERNVATQDSPHVEPDAGAIVYLTNPPASGPHYPTWARWGAWPNLARGYWVHNLEHGGVAYLYRCPSGTCDATRDSILAATRMIPTDRACMPDDASPARVRVVITNDNEITSPIAAAAWGWLYSADCVDPASIRSFYERHAGMAPEDFCADGFYP